MRRLAWLAAMPALGGCFLLPSGEASRVEGVRPELRRPRLVAPEVPDRHLYGDVTKVKIGDWATYREGERTFTLAAVATEADAVWIEVIEEGEPRLASARLVAPDGVVKRAFYREIAKEGRSAVVSQPLVQSVAAPLPPASSREAREETVKVGERELRAIAVRTRTEDLEGRLTEEIVLTSPEVPPLWSGGLVRRRSRTGAVDLLDFGTGAQPLVDIPK